MGIPLTWNAFSCSMCVVYGKWKLYGTNFLRRYPRNNLLYVLLKDAIKIWKVKIIMTLFLGFMLDCNFHVKTQQRRLNYFLFLPTKKTEFKKSIWKMSTSCKLFIVRKLNDFCRMENYMLSPKGHNYGGIISHNLPKSLIVSASNIHVFKLVKQWYGKRSSFKVVNTETNF